MKKIVYLVVVLVLLVGCIDIEDKRIIKECESNINFLDCEELNDCYKECDYYACDYHTKECYDKFFDFIKLKCRYE